MLWVIGIVGLLVLSGLGWLLYRFFRLPKNKRDWDNEWDDAW